MTHEERGRLGGIATKKRHGLGICPHCGQVMKTDFHRENGRKGGNKGGAMTKAIYGVEHYSNIGRLGGRGNTREKRLAKERESRQIGNEAEH